MTSENVISIVCLTTIGEHQSWTKLDCRVHMYAFKNPR